MNKKALDVLCQSGALKSLQDNRFTGAKHFWSAVAVDRPRKVKNLEENIKTYAPEGEFSTEETIQSLTTLTGVFPLSLVVDPDTQKNLLECGIPPISEYDPALGVIWFIPRRIIKKRTKNDKLYYVVEVIDSNNVLTTIRCWGVNPSRDHITTNKPYMAKLDYNEQWGFSCRSIKHTFREL